VRFLSFLSGFQLYVKGVFQREFKTARIYDFNEKRRKKHCV